MTGSASTSPGLLDQDPALGRAGDDVEGEEGVEGVVVGGGEVDGAFDRFFEQRRVGDQGAEL